MQTFQQQAEEDKQRWEKQVADFQTHAKKSNDELASLQASSSQAIADLQKQLKQSKDELTSLSVSSAASTATATKQIEALTVQGKKDAEEIATLKKQLADNTMNANQRVGVLERQCKSYETELASLQASSTLAIADLQTQLKKNNEEMTALNDNHNDLKKQWTTLQTQSTKTSDELTTMTAATKAAKTAADKTIADLHAQIQRNNDEMGVRNAEVGALKEVIASNESELAGSHEASEKSANEARSRIQQLESTLQQQQTAQQVPPPTFTLPSINPHPIKLFY